MDKITVDLDDIKETLSRGCEESGTTMVMLEMAYEALKNVRYTQGIDYLDELTIHNGTESIASLGDFIEKFWDRIMEGVINVIKTSEEV